MIALNRRERIRLAAVTHALDTERASHRVAVDDYRAASRRAAALDTRLAALVGEPGVPDTTGFCPGGLV